MPVYSFLEEYDFGAKTIIPFITHGGSGASRTVDMISQLQPGALMMGNERILSRYAVSESEDTVVAWAQGPGIRMIPQTCTYVWVVFMGYCDMKKHRYNKACSLILEKFIKFREKFLRSFI